MKRIGVATQHTTEGTSPASRQEVAPPTFSTISKCSFHQRRHYPQYQFGKLAKHWRRRTRKWRVENNYQICHSNTQTKSQACSVEKGPPRNYFCSDITFRLRDSKSKYISLNFESDTWALFLLLRWYRGYQRASPIDACDTVIVIIICKPIHSDCLLFATNIWFSICFPCFWASIWQN